MSLDIKIKIETIKGCMQLTKTPEEVKRYYRVILEEIRNLELERDDPKNAEKIKSLDSVLEMLGIMLMTACEEC